MGIIDSCITQLKVRGPSRTCDESKEEEEEEFAIEASLTEPQIRARLGPQANPMGINISFMDVTYTVPVKEKGITNAKQVTNPKQILKGVRICEQILKPTRQPETDSQTNPKQILKGVTGSMRSGTINAIIT